MDSNRVQKDLATLETELRRLEAEFNMFFAGRVARPPVETRARVAALVKQYDRSPIQNYGDRFRFTTLQSRYAALVDLWDRGLRARDEGRGTPVAERRPAPRRPPPPPADRILHVTAFEDPLREMDKLHDLYDSVTEARRQTGAEPLPFQRFAELVKNQVTKLKAAGNGEVAFRVTLEDGKVNLTARALKGARVKPTTEN